MMQESTGISDISAVFLILLNEFLQCVMLFLLKLTMLALAECALERESAKKVTFDMLFCTLRSKTSTKILG